MICLVTFGMATVVAYSRIHLKYHTPKQVLVGYTLGIVFGCVWYMIVEMILRPFVYPRIVSSWIARALLIRDSAASGNVFQFEYDMYKSLNRKRN
jgi:dolichyldiphosphatase